MSDNASYTMPNLQTNPANVALWAQASFFFYMCCLLYTSDAADD